MCQVFFEETIEFFLKRRSIEFWTFWRKNRIDEIEWGFEKEKKIEEREIRREMVERADREVEVGEISEGGGGEVMLRERKREEVSRAR